MESRLYCRWPIARIRAPLIRLPNDRRPIFLTISILNATWVTGTASHCHHTQVGFSSYKCPVDNEVLDCTILIL